MRNTKHNCDMLEIQMHACVSFFGIIFLNICFVWIKITLKMQVWYALKSINPIRFTRTRLRIMIEEYDFSKVT